MFVNHFYIESEHLPKIFYGLEGHNMRLLNVLIYRCLWLVQRVCN